MASLNKDNCFKSNLLKWKDRPPLQSEIGPDPFNLPGSLAYFCVQSGIGVHLEKFLPLELTGAYSFPGAEITIS